MCAICGGKQCPRGPNYPAYKLREFKVRIEAELSAGIILPLTEDEKRELYRQMVAGYTGYVP